MNVIAIDPGPVTSAVVVIDPITHTLHQRFIKDNEQIVSDKGLGFHRIQSNSDVTELAIEMMSPMGMTVGRSIFNTLVWIGRFYEAFTGEQRRLITRMDIKLKMCNSAIARDSDVRRAVMEHYEKVTPKEYLGGGKTPLVGTKTNPGPLFGVSRDLWQALAVALTYIDQRDVPF